MIHLGYETGTGKPVSIPLAHMAVTGQTQQSGKTTTLEALIDRGDLRAVVFVTKPGEKSFTEGRRILPFFRERADWEYVKELLEARRNESLSKWDGYLMRVCRGARTLQDVRRNVAKELPKKKSVRPSHYEVLAGYLDLIIPELERVEYTDKLDLRRGVNIMDLTGMADDMQTMVIRSTVEEIHKRQRNTVLVLPEAWKLIPEAGQSAVFRAIQSLVREGATNGNFVWIDAQDLAVVSKRILKSVTVWILGKQQEANEVSRTINHLIEPIHIKPDMIKSLGIGQFLICAESKPTRRVYVQPRWLGELDAVAIARGEESVETAQAIFMQKKRAAAAAARIQRNDVIRPEEMRIVTEPPANTFMRAAFPPPPRRLQILDQEKPEDGETEKPVSGDSAVERERNQAPDRKDGSAAAARNDAADGNPGIAEGEDEAIWKEHAEQSEAEVKRLIAEVRRLGGVINAIVDSPSKNGEMRVPVAGNVNAYSFTLADIYKYVREHAVKDPGILQLLVARPELRVTVEPKTIEITDGTLRGWLAVLISKGYFNEPRNGNTAFNELQRLGKKVAKRNVYRELDNLAEIGFLTKEDSGYQSTGLKITVAK